MLIPTKFNGYQAGIRLYPGGGGGSGGPAPQSSFEAMTGRSATGTQGNTNTSNTSTSTSDTPQFTVDQGPTPFVGPRTPSQIGRTMPGETPAPQPIYKSQYLNYVNPLVATNVSTYGTTQGPSEGYMAAMAPGGGGLGNYYQNLQHFGKEQGSQPYGMKYDEFNPMRKAIGATQSDLIAANSYNPMQGYGYGGGQLPQMQTPFNPYTNSYQSPFSYGGGQSQMVLPALGFGNQRSPFSYGGGAQLPQSMYGGVYGGVGGMGGMGGFGGYGQQPQQYMQQQPQQYMQQQVPQYMQQPSAPAAPMAPQSSGPSQPILSRAAMARGTPNVMRRAKGGIASLLDDSE